jgi:Flp pilus assembly protein TadG
MRLQFSDERGAALVEVALVASFVLLPMMLGAFELGRVAHYAIETQNAARAGASYGAENVSNASSATVTQAAKNDAPDLTSLSVTPGSACVCETLTLSTNTPSYNPTTGTTNCSNSIITSCTTANATTTQYVINYVTVSTSATVSPLFTVPGLPTSYTLHGYSALRVLPN